jgi:Zn finger protein HypA/HybF involved in hydrogenase expression
MKPRAGIGETREAVAALVQSGLSLSQVARKLGVSKPTVAYHARKLGIPADPKFSCRYDWDEVQRFYDAGNSITQCQRHFGFARKTFNDAVTRGVIKSRPQAAPIEVYLVTGRRTSRSHLKQRLIDAGLKQHQCETCGISEWRGKPLSMALHHINGDGLDNRVENLVVLCPNCHSQTPNFSGRALRVRRIQAALRRAGARPYEPARTHKLPVIGEAA